MRLAGVEIVATSNASIVGSDTYRKEILDKWQGMILETG